MKGQDLPTEALLYAFGNLHEKCEWNGKSDQLQLVQMILEQFAFPALDSKNLLLQARACWVYGKYGNFEFAQQEHL
jgi:hypothetical protein